MIPKEYMTFQRGEVWIVDQADIEQDFNIAVTGNEISKTRPWLIISNDVGNYYSPVMTCVALSSRVKNAVYRVNFVDSFGTPGSIMCEQIRTLDKRRFIRRLYMLPDRVMHRVEEAIRNQLVL